MVHRKLPFYPIYGELRRSIPIRVEKIFTVVYFLNV